MLADDEALVRAGLRRRRLLCGARRGVEVAIDDVLPLFEDEAAAGLLPEVIDETAWSAWTNAVKAETGAKGKALFMPLRLALTGQAHGPDMAALAPLIGRETMARRLQGEAA